MLNRTLHLVTNRTSFQSPTLVSDPDFQPATETSAEKEVRRILGVDNTRTDFSVIAMLGALHGHPWIFVEFRDEQQSYRMSDFGREPVLIAGATWIPDAQGAPFFSPPALSAPVPDKLTVTALSERAALVTYGEATWTLPARYVPDSQEVFVDWTADIGVRGGFRLGYTWQAGVKVEIYGTPLRYPWALVADALANNEAAHQLLLDAGLLEHFQLGDTPVERVAILALALAKKHPAFHG